MHSPASLARWRRKINNHVLHLHKVISHLDKVIWRPNRSNTISGFAFVDIAAFRRSKSITKPNFVDISQLMAEISYNYFRFLKNKRPPCWKFTFGFDFDHLPEICTLFCIRLPKFVQIKAPTAEISRHIDFWRWRPRRLNTTSGFVSVDVTAFRRSKSISKPHFVEISQMEAEIFLWQSKMAWEGVNFFQNQECVNILGCSVTFYEYKKCIFDACRQRLLNSGLICNQATALYSA